MSVEIRPSMMNTPAEARAAYDKIVSLLEERTGMRRDRPPFQAMTRRGMNRNPSLMNPPGLTVIGKSIDDTEKSIEL